MAEKLGAKSATVDFLVDLIAERIVQRLQESNGDTRSAVSDDAPSSKSTKKSAPSSGGTYTEKALSKMDRDELKSIADGFGIEYGQRTHTKTLIESIMEAQNESSDDADDDADDAGDDEDAVDVGALASLADDDEDEDAQAELTALAEEYGIDVDDYETWAEVAEAIAEEAGVVDEDEDAEDDDEDEDEEDDEDEDSEEMWTKEELQPKSIGELRAIAKEYGVNVKGLNKAKLIREILAA